MEKNTILVVLVIAAFVVALSLIGVSGYGSIDVTTPVASLASSIDVPTPAASPASSIDVAIPVAPLATTVDGTPIANDDEHPAGFYMPPEDFLTEEDLEFRQKVIETAGLDPNSPDLDAQLARLYSATDLSQFPNKETYRLFVDRLVEFSESQN